MNYRKGLEEPHQRGFGALRLVMAGAALGTALLVAGIAFAHGNGEGEAKVTVGNATVTITFGRPSLKGRDLMQMIQPGNLWRMGADMPTTIESTADLDFGGTRVPKGKHILLARYIGPGQWTLVVSSQDRQHYEPSAKLAEVPMQVEQGLSPLEEMNIELSAKSKTGKITVAWGSYRLTAPFSAAE